MAAAVNISSAATPTPSSHHHNHFLLPLQPTPAAALLTKTSFKTQQKPLSAAFSRNSLLPSTRLLPLGHVRLKVPAFFARSSVTDGSFDDKPREECGVVGIFGDPEASRLCYLALHALQHRGQEGAGIVSVESKVLHSITGVGLVSEVFTSSKLDHLPGSSAIGHVRYSTAGSSMLKNVQPFVAGC